MWQSKKGHTSFVKSFLHHEPEADRQDSGLQLQREDPQQTPSKQEARKTQGKAFLKDLIDTTSRNDDEVFLKVLGI